MKIAQSYVLEDELTNATHSWSRVVEIDGYPFENMDMKG